MTLLPNKFYNLITDHNAQLNVHLNYNENIDAVGIKLGSPITYVKWNINDERAEINNKKFYSRSYFNFGSQNNLAFAEMKFQFESNKCCLKSNNFISCLLVNIPDYSFRICKSLRMFDVKISIINKNARPHGIIGQTANEFSSNTIEGNLLDYEIKNLWNNNFKYNRFKESA